MFTHDKNLSLKESLGYENYLNVFKKLNFNIYWLSNNGACKGVCSAANFNILDNPSDDDIHLLDGLDEKINSFKKQNNLIYLHIRGSHGPEYNKRYPKKFKIYTPICKNKEIRKCSNEEIINSYDNSLQYNMYVISKIIELLKKKEEQFNVGLIFISDHGESLGEKGFYLHGAPYFLTKQEQGHVGSFMWFSDSFLKEFNINKQCLRKKTNLEFSHYNMFHTMLGLFKIENKFYDNKKDIFNECN
jgi:lipid A ethanolaminephosphotransferase